jgi:hypothetical protein
VARAFHRQLEAWVEADLKTRDGHVLKENARFASCRVLLGDGPPPDLGAGLELPPQGRAVADPYGYPASPVLLGQPYGGLSGIRLALSGNTATLTPVADLPPSLARGAPLPIALDALLRLGVLHLNPEALAVYVPVAVDRVAWASGLTAAGPLRLACTRPEPAGEAVRCARAVACDAAGRVVLELCGLEGRRLGAVPLGAAAASTR